MKTPIVTIVGKPNVGKSTLFNKMVGSRVAITADESGTTRDRLFHKVQHPVMDFFLVDTGGLEFGRGETTIEDDMQTQSRVAIEEADLIVFVVDSRTEPSSQDYAAAEILRTKGVKKPVFLVANKCDHHMEEAELAPFYALGLGEPRQLSAIHRTGIDRLVDEVIATLKSRHFLTKDTPEYKKKLEWEERQRNIALVGRPNVGKSSLINALLNQEKLIVSDIPGTTRDSTDSLIRHDGRDYNFIDTAGLKRPGKTGTGIEHFSTLRSMAAIERCDVALLVLDASQELSHQDQQVAHHVIEAGKGLVVLANKWDIPQAEKREEEMERAELKGEEEKEKVVDKVAKAEERLRDRYVARLRRKFQFLPWAPVIFTSAVTKKNFKPMFDQVDAVLEERKKRIPTPQLNSFVERLVMEHKPTGKGKVSPKIYYVTQPETDPPTFVVFVNRKRDFHFSYVRYIENRLREKFGFMGTPLKIEYRERERDPDRQRPQSSRPRPRAKGRKV